LRHNFDQGDFVKAVAFSPKGEYLVTGGRGMPSHIWDVKSGALLSTLAGQTPGVDAIAFNPNGETVATASPDGTARTWSVPGGAPRATFTGHAGPVTSVAFSPDSRELLTGSADLTARVWKNTKAPQVVALLAGHRDAVTDAVFSPDGSRVLTASRDRTARLWDPGRPTLQVLARFPKPVADAAYLNPYPILVVGGGDAVRVIRSDNGETVRIFRLTDAPAGMGLSPDLFSIAVAHGRTASIMITPRIAPSPVIHQLVAVTSVALSGTSGVVVTGGTDGVVRVWHSDGRFLYARRAHRRKITDVAIGPDGNLFATASRDGTARIWDVQTGRVLHTLVGHRASVTSVAFSPDGKLVLTSSKDDDARLWNVKTGARVQLLRWHSGAVSDAEFNPDGRWIVTAGPQTAQLWAPGVRDPFFQFGIGGPDKELTSVGFDPTSRIVLATSLDGTVRTYRCVYCGGLDEVLRVARARLDRTGRTISSAELRRFGG
jgi:WD40 repeat protein